MLLTNLQTKKRITIAPKTFTSNAMTTTTYIN